MAYHCQEAIKGLVKNDIRAPGIMWGTNSSRDMTFLLRMSRWSGKVSSNNTILLAGDEAEAQNGLGNWLRVNYTCTVDLSNNSVKGATLDQGRLQ